MMLDVAMLLGLAWKSAAVAGLSILLLRFARSRSAAERSMIAHTGLFALLALPAASLLLPEWAPLPADWAADAPPAVQAAAGTPAAPSLAVAAEAPPAALTVMPDAVPPAASWTLPAAADVAPWVYAAPLALLFALMLLAIVRLFAMRGRADVLVEQSWLTALAEAQRRMGFKHGTALLVSDELRSPISWGVLRPTIVLSPNAVAAVGEAEAIIAHELAHVARLDWAKLLAARVACALFWFNPLVWMLARESHQLREEAADDAVLLADIDGPDYATLLVGAARHDNQGALLAAHGVAPGKGSLKRRITRVLDRSLRRGPASATWMAMSIGFLAGVTLPLAAFSATAAPHREATGESGRLARAVAAPAAGPRSATATGGPAAATPPAAAAGAAPSEGVTVDDLIAMRAMGITPEDVKRSRDAGGPADPGSIVAAKATGTDPEYIAAMRRIIPGADIDELIGAKAVGVTPAYAREMRGVFPSVDLDDLIAMRSLGVDAGYVRDMRRAGAKVSDADEAIELRAVGAWRGSMTVPNVSVSSGGRSARISTGDGGLAIVAHDDDGRVTRVAVPAAAAPPEPPAPPTR